MTRDQFERLMQEDGWTPLQRAMWAGFTPVGDAESFRREMARPDGYVLSQRVSAVAGKPRFLKLRWKRVFKFLFRLVG